MTASQTLSGPAALRRRLARSAIALPASLLEHLRARLGGRARTRVIVLFACVLGLESADLASLGAVAGELKPALHLTTSELGILAAVPSLAAAVGTLPMGVLADRVRRVPILALSIAVWAAGAVLSALAGSFLMLVFMRLLLGFATATAAPFVASLVGDLFAGSERARIYGYILTGELLGGGVGLLLSGNLAAASWRLGFGVLALPTLLLALAIWRLLPEPARGGAGRLHVGDEAVRSGEGRVPAGAARARARHRGQPDASRPPEAPESGTAEDRDPERAAIDRLGVRPRADLILRDDPSRMPLRAAVSYVLRLRTNDLLIFASSLGYFFRAGLTTFAVLFVMDHFRLSQTLATWLIAGVALAALVGTVLGGRLADRMLAGGRVAARVVLAGVAFIVAALAFVPGLFTHAIWIAMPAYLIAAAALGAPNPPLDAARLDVVPSSLWGRAEGIRNVVRTLANASAPLAFGFVAGALASGHQSATKGLGYHASGRGLEYAFLLALVPMAISGVVLLRAARAYPRDVATAMASDAAADGRSADGPQGAGLRAARSRL